MDEGYMPVHRTETDRYGSPGFNEVKVAESPVSYSATGNTQICIETGYCRLTAGSGYPVDALVSVLREFIKP